MAIQKNKLITCILLTLTFTIVEAYGAAVTNSLALLSESMHVFNDLISYSIALVISLASSGLLFESKQYTFKFSRFDIIGGVLNNCFLASTMFNLILESLNRLIKNEHDEIKNIKTLFLIANLSLLNNVLTFFIMEVELPGGKHHHHGSNIKAVLLHIIGDTTGSIIAIVNAFIIEYSQYSWRFNFDPAGTIISSIIIGSISVYKMCTDIPILLDKCPESIDIDRIKQFIESHNFHTKYLHVWKVDNEDIVGFCSLTPNRKLTTVSDNENFDDSLEKIKAHLKEEFSIKLAIEINPTDFDPTSRDLKSETEGTLVYY